MGYQETWHRLRTSRLGMSCWEHMSIETQTSTSRSFQWVTMWPTWPRNWRWRRKTVEEVCRLARWPRQVAVSKSINSTAAYRQARRTSSCQITRRTQRGQLSRYRAGYMSPKEAGLTRPHPMSQRASTILRSRFRMNQRRYRPMRARNEKKLTPNRRSWKDTWGILDRRPLNQYLRRYTSSLEQVRRWRTPPDKRESGTVSKKCDPSILNGFTDLKISKRKDSLIRKRRNSKTSTRSSSTLPSL